MFVIYINNLPNSINYDAKLFADETCLFLHASKPLILEEKTNDALESIHKWTIANKLTVNPSKSSVLIIPPKQTISTLSIEIRYNHTKIVVKECIKYLGVEIDSRLNS